MTDKQIEINLTQNEMNKHKAPVTMEVASVKRQLPRDKAPVQPIILFPEEEAPILKQRPARSDPLSQGKRPKGRDKALVETATGKKVLSSDVRLHLEKLQRQQKLEGVGKQGEGVVDEELRTLENERKLLAEKIKKKKEILKLQRELSDVSERRISSEYQTEDYDSSWRPTTEMEYSSYEESTGSQISKKKRRKQDSDDEMEDEESIKENPRNRKNTRQTKFEEDMALIKNFIRTQSGGIEVVTESPLTEFIENAKINRDLKVPPIESFDGSTDPSDFINLFDGRMDFFGHSEVARCRFFSTCLKGTALHWFNNLQPRSLDSWASWVQYSNNLLYVQTQMHAKNDSSWCSFACCEIVC